MSVERIFFTEDPVEGVEPVELSGHVGAEPSKTNAHTLLDILLAPHRFAGDNNKYLPNNHRGLMGQPSLSE